MDINILRTIVAITGLVVFVALMIWAWRNRKSKDFKEAAELPFKED